MAYPFADHTAAFRYDAGESAGTSTAWFKDSECNILALIQDSRVR